MNLNKLKKISVNDLLPLIALLIAAGLVYNTIRAMQHNYRLQQQYNQLVAEVELKELENQNLRYTIEYLKSDGYLEQAARAKAGKATNGETLVLLPTSGIKEQATVAQKTPAVKPIEKSGWQANVRAWWEFLQGKTALNS